MVKKCVEFSLISFGTAKYYCVIKTREIFNFLPLINNSDTIGLNYFLLSISAITSSKTINYLHFLFELYSSISFEYSIKTLESFKCFKPVLSRLSIKN